MMRFAVVLVHFVDQTSNTLQELEDHLVQEHGIYVAKGLAVAKQKPKRQRLRAKAKALVS
jgi:hypothetical protein